MLRFLLVHGQGRNYTRADQLKKNRIKKLKFSLKYIDIDLQEKK